MSVLKTRTSLSFDLPAFLLALSSPHSGVYH